MNRKNRYSPSWFIAMCCPKQVAIDKADSLDEFLSLAGVEPNISVDTGSFMVYLASSSSTQIVTDQNNQVTLILHGEIYDTADNQAEFLLKKYIKHGIGFSKDINGSFAVLLIDKGNNIVSLITDRINTRKVFYSKHKEAYWLSTSLYLHPTADVDLDTVGVACYLANGVIYNNRTLFDGVRTLERACYHILTQNGLHTTRYWSYEFTTYDSYNNEKVLRAELTELLFESVKVRLRDNPKVFLSLSAGYDSTGILGILSSNVKEANCFSYLHGELSHDCDAYLAREMAEYSGFNHRIVQSYKGNVLNVIKRNAEFGHGLAHFCDEVDAWTEMADDLSLTTSSVLFVGEACFGWICHKLNSADDVLDTLHIYDFNRLSWLKKMLPEGTYDILCNGLKEDTQQIFLRCPATQDLHNSKDFLHLDQRINHFLMPWREFFAGQYVTVRNPFVDNSLLDFMKKVPTHLRRGKLLYKTAITEMFPDLFKIERAKTTSYIPDWREEFRTQRLDIEAAIVSQESKLDRIIPPEVIIQLLRRIKKVQNDQSSIKARSKKLAGRLMKKNAITERMLRRFCNTHQKQIDPTTFLKRILVIRMFLSNANNSKQYCV